MKAYLTGLALAGLLCSASSMAASFSYDEWLDGDLDRGSSLQVFSLAADSLDIRGYSTALGFQDIDQDWFLLRIQPGYQLTKAFLHYDGPIEISNWHDPMHWLPGGGDLLYFWGADFAKLTEIYLHLGAALDGSYPPFTSTYHWQFEAQAIARPNSLSVNEPGGLGLVLTGLLLIWRAQRQQRIGKAAGEFS